MGRKRIDENERKKPVTVGIKLKYWKILREKESNISEIVNNLLERYIREKYGNK